MNSETLLNEGSAALHCYADLVEAANRLARVDDGEPIGNVYPDSDGGECSTTLTDTETLCDAWIEEHINGGRWEYEQRYYDLMDALKRSKMEHGDCDSGKRYGGIPRACTACMAQRKLDEALENYRGRPVRLA